MAGSDIAATVSPEADQQAHRIGRIRLAPGVRPRHVFAYAILALTAVSFTGFTPIMLPYLLSGRLHTPANQLGALTGAISGGQNLTIGALSLVFGALADHLGRRRLLVFAYIAMAGGVALYPLQTSAPGFFSVALLIGAGLGAQLVANQALGIDYPRNESRGLYLSSMLVVQLVGTALIVGQIGVRLPVWAAHWGVGDGFSVAFWCIAAMGAPALLLVLFGLKPETSRITAGAGQTPRANIVADLAEFARHTRQNGGFQMALLGSMTVRGDLAVVATFLALAVASAARAHGVPAILAAKHAGAVYSCVQGGALAGALIMGLLLDRFDRRKLQLAGLGMVSVALLTPLLVKDMMSAQADIAALVLGLAEGAITVPTSALLGQEAPPHLRGLATSVFVLLGVLGVAGMNLAGGLLFDRFGALGPFVMAAVLNTAILTRGLFIVWGRRAARA